MRRYFRFVLVAGIVISLSYSANAGVSPEQIEVFREFTRDQMSRDQIPGLSAGYISWNGEEETLWTEGFGFSDLENKVAARAESAYRLASVSKTMTSAAVLKLMEQGKIDLDAEVQKYVPYFPKKKWPVTIRQLLGHLGGISHYQNYDVEGRIKEHKTTREAIAIFENFDLIAEPGTYNYSSYGYNLLGAALESASGMSFGDYMRKNIWDPLEMKHTRLDDPNSVIPNRVRGYRILEGEIKNSEFVDISSRFAAGGTRSTIPDVLRFAKGLASGKIVSSKTLEMMFTSMVSFDRHLTDYGMGWGMLVANGRFAVSHGGSQQETRTILYLFPTDHFAIAVAINQEDASPAPYARKLYEILRGEKWNFAAYTPKVENSYRTINEVFDSGLAYFQQHGRALTEDQAQLSKAFAYVNSCLESATPEIQKKINEGRHPAGGQSFQKVGSYIANQLQKTHGDGGLESYHNTGPIVFVNGFIKITKNDTDLQFSDSFVKIADRWNDSWKATNTEKFRTLTINEDSDLEAIQKDFQNTFTSHAAYPDFSRELANLSIRFARKGVTDKSLQAAKIDITFYPDLEISNAAWGAVNAAFGDEAVGLPALKKAIALDPEGSASAESLSDLAYEIATSGNIKAAVQLMKAAVNIHPGNGQLYCDLGEAYLAQEDQNSAITTIKKGLALDPELKCAKDLLANLPK